MERKVWKQMGMPGRMEAGQRIPDAGTYLTIDKDPRGDSMASTVEGGPAPIYLAYFTSTIYLTARLSPASKR